MTDKDPKAVLINVLKGGLGKTTVTKNTANSLGQNARVLLVDVDDNGHLSKHLGFREEFIKGDTLADVLNQHSETQITDLIQPTKFNFDFIPSTHHMEHVEAACEETINSNMVLRNEITEPLLGEAYDYILFDTPANRSLLTRNAAVAAGNLIMPLSSGEEGNDGLEATFQRIYKELNQQLPGGLKLLAIVPNQISDRIDQRTADRTLLEYLNTKTVSELEGKEKTNTTDEIELNQFIPNFARIPQEVWDAIDSGKLNSNPKPGIRIDSDLDNRYPIHEVNPESESIKYFDELAEIIQHGKIQRNDDEITDQLMRDHGGALI